MKKLEFKPNASNGYLHETIPMDNYYEEVKREVAAWPKWKKDFFKALRINDDTYYIRRKKKKEK